MDHVEQVPDIRQIVVQILAELRADPIDQSRVRETLLLRDSAHPGRRFVYDDIRAVWFSDLATIDFFSADGEFIRTVVVEGNPLPSQAAA